MSTDPEISSIDSTDPSPYIRTYAKDVAALTGQKPVVGQTPAPVDTSPTLPHRDEGFMVSSAPSTKLADLGQLQRDAASNASKGESAQEAEERIQDMGNAASSGILQSISLPSIQPGDIVQGEPTAPSTADAAADREALLARLRAKAAAARPAETPLMPSNFALPAFESVVPPPPPAPEPIPAPVPPEVPTSESPFHSFSSDFADRIDEQHASTFSVLAAEKDSAPRKTAPQKKRGALLPILAGIVLVFAGIGGVFAAYRFMTATAPVASISAGSYLIVPDEKVALSGSGSSLLQALAQQANQPIPESTVLLTYTTSASTTAQGIVQAPTSGGAFLKALNLSAPDILLRNISPSSMIGVVNDGNQTRAFFILRVDSYQSTFAGMLQWEPNIGSILALLYPAYPAPMQVTPVVATTTTSTTTATSTKTVVKTAATTVVTAALPITPPQFIDEVVANHNARALKDYAGRTILVYGYADQQTLIIARDEGAFTLLLGRLQANQQ